MSAGRVGGRLDTFFLQSLIDEPIYRMMIHGGEDVLSGIQAQSFSFG